MPVLTSDQIAEIRARNEARAKGKWESGSLFKDQTGDYVVWASRGKRRAYIGNVGALTEPVLEASPGNDIIFDVERKNAVFIVACSEDIPNILATLDAREERVKELEEGLKEIMAGKWTESGDKLGAAFSEIRAMQRARKALGQSND